MRIGASSSSALPVPVDYRREGIAERQARQSGQAVQTVAEIDQAPVEREVTRIRARASAAAQTGTDQPSFADVLTPHSRNALLSYTSNGPTIEERLGVDLAGIDVYA